MSDSIFSRIANGQVDSDLTVYSDKHVFVQVSLHQKARNRGHVLVIPKQQVKDIFESPPELDAPIFSVLRLTSVAVQSVFEADGIQIRQNNGAASGQDVFHMHFHIIPRFDDDDFEDAEYEVVPRSEREVIAERIRAQINLLA